MLQGLALSTPASDSMSVPLLKKQAVQKPMAQPPLSIASERHLKSQEGFTELEFCNQHLPEVPRNMFFLCQRYSEKSSRAKRTSLDASQEYESLPHPFQKNALW